MAVLVVQVVRRRLVATKAQRRPVRAALARVVVDDVDDDLDVGGVQRGHHGAELLDLASGLAGVSRVRGEEAQRRVAPVVVAPGPHQRRLVAERLDRQQLDAGDPESHEMLDHGGVGQAEVRPPQRLGHIGMPGREALDVQLVDHGLLEGDLRLDPGVRTAGARDDAERHRAERVDRGRLDPLGVVGIAERRIDVRHGPADPAGVRVDQQLVRVAPQTVLGLVRPVDAIAVLLSWRHPRDQPVPHAEGALGQLDPPLMATVFQVIPSVDQRLDPEELTAS